MASKRLGYYTTDIPDKVISNHLSEIKYDELNTILYIKFHNGALYEFLGVPVGKYRAMMASPSHGTYFCENIRQCFPHNIIPDITKNVCPEELKLDALDKDERELDKQLRKGLISKAKHTSLLNVIKTKRERLMKKLEKDGYFSEELGEEFDEQGQNYSAVGLVINALGKSISLAFKVLFICFGVFFGLMGALMR